MKVREINFRSRINDSKGRCIGKESWLKRWRLGWLYSRLKQGGTLADQPSNGATKSFNFYRLRVGVVGQCVHCVVGRLALFLHGFFFRFKGVFRWFIVLILHWFNHKEPTLLAAMFSAPCISPLPLFGAAVAVFAAVAVAWISILPLPLSSPPRCCCLRHRRCRLDYVVDTRLSLRRRSLQLTAVIAAACRRRCYSSRVSPCCDFLGLDSRPMLNSAKRDRIFSSMRFSKASNFALIVSSDAIVYASRSVILRSFFCCRVSGMRILEKGVVDWKVNRFGWE
ncbi:hypothetical protein GW17_00033123 [Ensete ventricosum]|nr:hypothetical protein GW17_00033123 [Ensete ventricosum]